MKIIHSENSALPAYERIVLTDGKKYPLHWHGNIEVIFVEKGSIRLAIRKRSYDVLEGEFAVINSSDHHAYHIGYSVKSTVLHIFSFSPIMVSSISKLRLNVSYIAKNEDIDRLELRNYLQSAMKGYIHECGAKSDYSDALTGSYVIQLLLNLQKTYIEKEDKGTTINVEYEHLFNNFMYNYDKNSVGEKTMGKFQLILDYLDKNFNDTGLTLTTLSEISSLSECYISELFTIIVGIKFKQYLNTLRINYALRLLSMSEITISGAAYDSGFETIRTFNSAFKRLKGVTPSEYINGLRGKNDVSGIITEIRNLCAENMKGAGIVSYFPGGCDIRLCDDPCGNRGKVFGIFASNESKTWTTFNVPMLFKAGKKYHISFDVYYLDDAKGNACFKNTIGTNLFYAETDGDAVAHSGCGTTGSTGDGWIHCDGEMCVSDKYVPGLYDKFSIFGNPANNVGVNYLLDNICCYEM